MADSLPKFDRPPVTETVLGVQFNPLKKFTSAHAGWFWQDCLPTEWREGTVKDAQRLPDVFERFGAERLWMQFGLQLRSPGEWDRIQIIRRGEDRMIQLQDSRFIYNWRRKEGDYPSYDVIAAEFRPLYERFEVFLRTAGLGELDQNQWEVTYVNQVQKGVFWTEVSDWPGIIKGFYVPTDGSGGPGPMDSFGGDWSLALPEQRGRLHVGVRHAPAQEGRESLVIQLAARGPIDAAKGWTLTEGFDIGHRAIVRTFAGMLTPAALNFWGVKRGADDADRP